MVVFKPFDEVILKERNWTEAAIEEPRPSLADFEMNRIAIPIHLRDEALDYLEEKHFCIIVGDINTGKTWLSFSIGKKLMDQRKDVMYTEVDNNFNGDKAWNDIKDFKTEIFFIIEDCYVNPRESEKFLEKILDERKENFRFSFNTRKVGKFLLRNLKEIDLFYKEMIAKRECMIDVSDNKELIKNIILKFIEVKEIEYKLSEEELDSIAKEWGNDLYLVWLRLIFWQEYQKEKKLTEVDEGSVYKYLWEYGYEGMKLSDEKHRQILLPLAILCQFEPLKVTKKFLEDQGINKKTLDRFMDKGIVHLFLHDFLGFSEKFAKVILATTSYNDDLFRSEKDECTKQLFKNYMKSEPSNLYVVFQALYRAKSKKKLAKDILISFLDDTIVFRVIKKNVKSFSLRKITSLLDALLWAKGKKKYWEDEKVLKIWLSYVEHNYGNIRDRFKKSSATTIGRYLPLLAQITDLNLFFESFSISDFKNIVQQSSIYGIRSLFLSFEYWKIPNVACKLAEALMNLPKAELVNLIAKHDSLYRIGGLIGNVRKVNELAAIKFVEKLSQINLSGLFSKIDPPAQEKGFSKVKVINYFLSHHISFTPQCGKRIVNNVDDDLWLDFIDSTSLDESVWLLWNIYRHDREKARCLVQKNAALLLLKKTELHPKKRIRIPVLLKRKKKEKIDYYLPLIGLLHECGFDVSNISLPEKDILKIKQRLKLFEKWGLKKKIQPTLFILALIALRVKLSSEQYISNIKGFILDNESMHRHVYLHDDLQIRKIFTDLIKKYSLH